MGKVELKLEIDADLLKQAKAARVPISRVVEAALKAQLPPNGMEERAAAWAAENADAIKDHEERIAKYGVFGDDLRTWSPPTPNGWVRQWATCGPKKTPSAARSTGCLRASRPACSPRNRPTIPGPRASRCG